jgi:nucleotide-binding universal stress UspA family protein
MQEATMLQSNHRPVALLEEEPGHDRPFRIVCGLDGSPGSVDIAHIATGLALALDGAVEFLHVLDGGPRLATDRAVRAERARANAMLDGLCDASGPPASGRLIEFGEPGRRIADAADLRAADMIVVGSRGNAPAGDPLLGSVSSRLAADAPCPVLIVPPELQQHVRPSSWWARTVVCGFDGSAAGWAAALHAGRLAAALRGTLELVSVGDHLPWRMSDIAGEVSGRLTSSGLLRRGTAAPAIDWAVHGGDPAWELECVASTATAPLIAVGSRGLGPHIDPLLGSTVRRLLLTARRPVLVTPATARESLATERIA